MATKTDLQITALTDRGMERDHNEDYHGFIPDLETGEVVFFDSRDIKGLSEKGSLLIVADGMGGTNAGEVASKIAVETVIAFIQQQIAQAMPDNEIAVKSVLVESVKIAQKGLVDHQKHFPETEGMGTTLVVAWIIKNRAFIIWVGDSRLYVHNKSGLKQLSHDHSFVQELVDSGKLTAEQAFYHPQSNIITQYLGEVKRPPIPGYITYNIQTGDIFLICSDGLNGMVTDSHIEHFLDSNPVGSEAAKTLIDEANKAGGHDNITVLVAHFDNIENPLPEEPMIVERQNRQSTSSNLSNNTTVNQLKKRSKRTKILFLAIIVVLLGFLLFQNKTTIQSLFNGQKPNSTNKGDTINKKGNSTLIDTNVKTNKYNSRSKTPEPKKKDGKGENNKDKKGNSLDEPLQEDLKAENNTKKFKPILDALNKVNNAFQPIMEDSLSKTFKKELGKCIEKAKAFTLSIDDIKTLYEAKKALHSYDATGISDLNKAVNDLFKFLPDLTPQ